MIIHIKRFFSFWFQFLLFRLLVNLKPTNYGKNKNLTHFSFRKLEYIVLISEKLYMLKLLLTRMFFISVQPSFVSGKRCCSKSLNCKFSTKFWKRKSFWETMSLKLRKKFIFFVMVLLSLKSRFANSFLLKSFIDSSKISILFSLNYGIFGKFQIFFKTIF